jgi:hypothetical protein
MNTIVDTAKSWTEKGVTPIPLVYKTKMPLVKWQSIRKLPPPPDSILEKWFGTKQVNMGLLCGGVNNLVVVDFDDMPLYYEYKTNTNKQNRTMLDSTFSVRTSRGLHFYFFSRSEQERTRSVINYHVDIKTDGGMVTTPPSIHPSGSEYIVFKSNNILTIDSTTELLPDNKPHVNFDPAEYDIFNYSMVDYDDQKIGINTIKSRVKMIDIVAPFISKAFQSSNRRYIQMTCFAHKDTNPSLSVDLKNNTVKCFSTSCVLGDRWHDVISIYSILHNVSTKDAIKALQDNIAP